MRSPSQMWLTDAERIERAIRGVKRARLLLELRIRRLAATLKEVRHVRTPYGATVAPSAVQSDRDELR